MGKMGSGCGGFWAAKARNEPSKTPEKRRSHCPDFRGKQKWPPQAGQVPGRPGRREESLVDRPSMIGIPLESTLFCP